MKIQDKDLQQTSRSRRNLQDRAKGTHVCLTTAVHRLESSALVHRGFHPEDRRARVVHLAEQGRRIIERALEQHAHDMERMIEVVNVRERIELVRLLKKLGRSAEAKSQ